jgi:hypothetical protein
MRILMHCKADSDSTYLEIRTGAVCWYVVIFTPSLRNGKAVGNHLKLEIGCACGSDENPLCPYQHKVGHDEDS